MKTRHGFSLIEVLIVLAILAILASIAVPNYAGYVARTRRVEGQVALIEAMQRQERYFSRHHTYIAFSSASTAPDAAAFTWWSGRNAAASAYELDGHACQDRALTDCIEISARPGTARVDTGFRDPACGTLTLDNFGNHGANGVHEGQGSGASGRCWP